MWTKPLLDEVIIGERDALELKRHVKERVVAMVTTHSFKHLVQGPPHHRRSWVMGLVHAIAKTHESERITLVLGTLDVFRNAGDRADRCCVLRVARSDSRDRALPLCRSR